MNIPWPQTTEPNLPGTYQVPNTCPGCGRCKTCGYPNTLPLPISWPGTIWAHPLGTLSGGTITVSSPY